MRKRRGGMSTLTVGLLALVVTIVGVYLGFTKSIPFRSHYEVKAAFKSANNIRRGSPVRIAGVEVGKVTKIERGHEGDEGAVLTMRIQDKGRPLHPDAHFKIRPRIFLEGNFFVDVTPGTSSREVADNHTFPVQQTDTPVQLDQVLTALQTDTREDLKTVLREYSSGLKGKGAKGFNGSIKYWKPAYRDSAIVSEATLGEKEHDLSGYIDRAGIVAGALDRHREQLKDLITNFRVTAGAFARENGNLEAAIAELPRTLRTAQPALAALNRSFPGLRGFAHDIRPGVENSEETIDVSLPLAQAAARARLAAGAARPDRRPAPDGAGARELRERERAAQQAGPAGVELPDRGHPAVDARTSSRTRSSRRPGRSTRSCRSRSRASPVRAAPATPTASGSACSPPAARTS